MTKIQITDNIKCQQEMELQKLSFIAGGKTNHFSHSGNLFGIFSQGKDSLIKMS
jgi:hypothetical protein